MAEKKNTKRNTPKPKASSSTRESTGKKNGLGKFIALIKNEKTIKVLGLFLILFSVYLLVAFISFFFSWQTDFDQVNERTIFGVIFDNSIKASNVLGRLGAIISHVFIYKWFGIGAFLLVPMFFLIGCKMLIPKLEINRIALFLTLFFPILWVSTTVYFLIPVEGFEHLSGGFGIWSNEIAVNLLGKLGTGLFLLFTALIYTVIKFNLSFDFNYNFKLKMPFFNFFKNKQQKIEELDKEEDEYDSEVENEFEDDSKDDEPEVDENNLELIEVASPIELQKPSDFEKSIVKNPQLAEKNIEDAPRQNIVDNESEQTKLPIESNPEPTAPIVLRTQIPETTTKANGEIGFIVERAGEEIKSDADTLEEHNSHDDIPISEYDPTADLSHYKYPPLDILEDHKSGNTEVTEAELNENKDKIVGTLKNYNIDIASIKATIGPTVTLYEIVPAPGVRISKIKSLEDDIALSLAALGIRIIAPMPGKGTIGIEVPNQNPEVVSMLSVLNTEKFQKSKHDLPIALGKTISNEVFIADLAKMPHLLMAGATGQGKSVGLNAILVSLLYKKHPSTIKFVLIDPKKVELTLFNSIEKHFLAKLPNEEEAIITDTKKVVATLNSLCIEMDNRYELLKIAQVRNIKEYNAKFTERKLNPHNGHKFLPYIVVVIDEFADLIMTAGKEVETPIARLAQLARAIGIHLIIATQRPSVNIITGIIKANFPARIAFRVTAKIDSRTILDTGGADQLIGRGDMLLSTGSDLLRLQCPFVDTPEVAKLTEYIGKQQAPPFTFELPEYISDEDAKDMDMDFGERDPLFEEAAMIIVSTQQGSTSMLQRRLKLGYNRAGRLMDQMQKAGIVGPSEGSKPRQVNIPDTIALEQFLNTMNNK